MEFVFKKGQKFKRFIKAKGSKEKVVDSYSYEIIGQTSDNKRLLLRRFCKGYDDKHIFITSNMLRVGLLNGRFEIIKESYENAKEG